MYRGRRSDWGAPKGGRVVKRNWSAAGAILAGALAFAACGSGDEGTSAAPGATGSSATGTGAASLNVAQCDPAGGWKSAVKVATGAKDRLTLEKYAAALSEAGYRSTLHLGPDAGSSAADADAVGGADAAAEVPDTAAGEVAADAQTGDALEACNIGEAAEQLFIDAFTHN